MVNMSPFLGNVLPSPGRSVTTSGYDQLCHSVAGGFGGQGVKRGGWGAAGNRQDPQVEKISLHISHHMQLYRSRSSTDWAPKCEEDIWPKSSSLAGRNDRSFRGASLTDAHLLAPTPQAQAPHGPGPGSELSGPQAGDGATPGCSQPGRSESRARNGGEHRESEGRGADHGFLIFGAQPASVTESRARFGLSFGAIKMVRNFLSLCVCSGSHRSASACFSAGMHRLHAEAGSCLLWPCRRRRAKPETPTARLLPLFPVTFSLPFCTSTERTLGRVHHGVTSSVAALRDPGVLTLLLPPLAPPGSLRRGEGIDGRHGGSASPLQGLRRRS
jgi:hypothetical protein